METYTVTVENDMKGRGRIVRVWREGSRFNAVATGYTRPNRCSPASMRSLREVIDECFDWLFTEGDK